MEEIQRDAAVPYECDHHIIDPRSKGDQRDKADQQKSDRQPRCFCTGQYAPYEEADIDQ